MLGSSGDLARLGLASLMCMETGVGCQLGCSFLVASHHKAVSVHICHRTAQDEVFLWRTFYFHIKNVQVKSFLQQVVYCHMCSLSPGSINRKSQRACLDKGLPRTLHTVYIQRKEVAYNTKGISLLIQRRKTRLNKRVKDYYQQQWRKSYFT